MCEQAERVFGLLLVAMSLVSVNIRAAQTPAGESQLITPQSIKGIGEYSNSESLIVDGQTPPEETGWNEDQCVYWTTPKTRFVLTLDGAYQITGLTIQADNNDDYVIEGSMDGKSFSPLLVVKGEWGEVFTGAETLSTLQDDPHFLPEMIIKPAQAKYVRLSARGGDEAYGVSELVLYGSKVQSVSVPPVVVTEGGSTPPVAQAALLKAKSIKGSGEFSHAAKLIIDQKMPRQGTEYDNKACVYWNDPKAYFVIDLGEAFWITGLTIQADNNDDYVIGVSTDGKTFKPLLTASWEWGEVSDGMETLSTLAKDPQHVPEMAIKPAQARYVRLSAKGGDEAYAVSELLLYGSKTAPVVSPTVSQTPTGTGQPTEGTPGLSGGIDGDLESIFNAIDANKDGRISKEEYAAIWKDKSDVDKKFAFFDRDGSGYIEKAEYLGLRDKLKDQAGQDQPGQSEQAQEESAHLDPAMIQKAIDALPKWVQINQLLGAGKYEETNQIAKELGFENWVVLNFYYSIAFTIGQAVESDPNAKSTLVPAFGQEAVDLVAQPENLAKIKEYAPK
jgi:hypothetical protein